MSPPDPTDSREWWREIWQFTRSWDTCTRCGVRILKSHLAEGVCSDRAECDVTLARKPEPLSRSFARCDWWCDMCRDRVACESKLKMRPTSDLVAATRLESGSPVVAFASPGIEVRAFTREDLDEHGMPRWVR